MSSRYRRGDQHTAYAVDYENIGERNPAYIGDGEDREELMNARERGGGGTCGAIVSWMTFAFAIIAAVFSIVAMSFSISNNNKLGNVQSMTASVYDGTSSDDARYFRDDIFLQATHGRSYYSKDVPTLDNLERVSTYVQQVLYPMNTQLKIQKVVYAVVPDADGVLTAGETDGSAVFDLKHLNKKLTSGNELCTYTYSAVPSSDEFDYFTIPKDATFVVDGSNPPAPCTYDWPSADATMGNSTNYVVLITAMINGATMKPTLWTGVSDPSLSLTTPAKYSSNLLYHIVNERISFVSTDPASADITAPDFMQKFIPFGRVYGYGNVDLTFTVGTDGTPSKFTYSSYDAVGVPLSLPQSVFVSLCNTANTANNGVATYAGTTLTIKAEAIDGVYPTNPASAKMTFAVADGSKIPKMMFADTLPTKQNLLMLDLLTPVSTAAPSNPFIKAIASSSPPTIHLYPFGSTHDYVSISSSSPSIVAGNNKIYGTTLPTSSLSMKVVDYTLKFNDVSVIPEFTTKTCTAAAGSAASCAASPTTAAFFNNFIKINPTAASIIQKQRRTVVFEIKRTSGGSTTYYHMVYGPGQITVPSTNGAGSIAGAPSATSDISSSYATPNVFSSTTTFASLSLAIGNTHSLTSAPAVITHSTSDTHSISIYDLGIVASSASSVTVYGKATHTPTTGLAV
jgi:hypothetical protein